MTRLTCCCDDVEPAAGLEAGDAYDAAYGGNRRGDRAVEPVVILHTVVSLLHALLHCSWWTKGGNIHILCVPIFLLFIIQNFMYIKAFSEARTLPDGKGFPTENVLLML